MKKLVLILMVIVILCISLVGCVNTAKDVPQIVKNTNGGEKWEAEIDYENKDNWLALTDIDKKVDVIYFYPAVFNKTSEDAPRYIRY